MSDHIPSDIQEEIMKKLPVKSLIRFRSVSKPWKSLIDSSKFINDHGVRNNQPHHILVRYKLGSELKYVSIVDDDTFPKHKFSVTVPVTVKLLSQTIFLGSSHGLLCLHGSYQEPSYETEMVVLWNPSIGKSVGIVLPNMLSLKNWYVVIGFGVCPNTWDPKLVKITYINDVEDAVNCIHWEVHVFSLSSGAWRSVSCNLPREPIQLAYSEVVINGVIYWQAYDIVNTNVGSIRYRIFSFDLTSEEFREIFLPYNLEHSSQQLFISKLMESLVVIECYHDEPVSVLWKMNHGVLKSLTKLRTYKGSDNVSSETVLEFRKNGEPIMQTKEWSNTREVHEPFTWHTKDLKIHEDGGSLNQVVVNSYTETLLLLHHSDSIIHYRFDDDGYVPRRKN